MSVAYGSIGRKAEMKTLEVLAVIAGFALGGLAALVVFWI